MVIRKHQFDIGVKVWRGQRTWFWFVARQCGDGGTIGTAATEADAIRSARASVEAVFNDALLQGKATR
jgi:hypothetical protein